MSELLAHGDEAERAATPANELSSLFAGGMGVRVHAVVTLAAPTNGTTAYDLFEDPHFDASAIRVPAWAKAAARMMSRGTQPKTDSRDERDYAGYDMHIDRARQINEHIATLPYVYYVAVPCSATTRRPDGTFVPKHNIEPLFVQRAYQIGAYVGTTAKGVPIDESWRENDGLVNTVSAMAPHNAPHQAFDCASIKPGVWNVMPVVDGDHMWLQGGLTQKHDVRAYYRELLGMIDALA